MTIRPLTCADLNAAQSLRELAGWNQTDADWRRLIEFDPEGCFLLEHEGEAAGTVTTLTYGAGLAWIGMMLVAPRFRRRGFASRLLEHALQFLTEERSAACIRLDATPAGCAVYESFGFHADYTLTRWRGEIRTGSPPVKGHDLDPSHLTLDSTAFGADRSRYLRILARDSHVTVFDEAFGMTRTGTHASYLGPAVAASGKAGTRLIESLLNHIPENGPVIWDIPDPNGDARALAEKAGFTRERELIRMTLRPATADDRPELQWAIGAPETG